MTSTLSRITIVFALLLSLHAPLFTQDGIAWLQPSSPYNIRSGAFMMLHGGGGGSGTSFGFANTISVPAYRSASVEGMLLFNGRRASAGDELSMQSALAMGLRVDCAVSDDYILPIHAGLASVNASHSAAHGFERSTQLYAGVRAELRVLRIFELVGAAGIIRNFHSGNMRPYCTVGIRAGSVFTLSLDVAGFFNKGAGETCYPPLLR